MTAPGAPHRHAWSALVFVLFLGAVGVLAWLSTTVQSSSAAFADREVLDRNSLGAATLDISVGDDTVRFAAEGLAAGDRASGRFELINSGTLPLRYGLSASADSSPLGDVLELIAWRGDSVCTSVPPPSADSRWRPLDDLASTGGAAAAPAIGGLAPGESDLLCLAAFLPLSAPTALQGQRLVVDFTVHAEHDQEASP